MSQYFCFLCTCFIVAYDASLQRRSCDWLVRQRLPAWCSMMNVYNSYVSSHTSDKTDFSHLFVLCWFKQLDYRVSGWGRHTETVPDWEFWRVQRGSRVAFSRDLVTFCFFGGSGAVLLCETASCVGFLWFWSGDWYRHRPGLRAPWELSIEADRPCPLCPLCPLDLWLCVTTDAHAGTQLAFESWCVWAHISVLFQKALEEM